MKAFTFKLQAILNLRTMAKNEALQSYVASQQKRKALEEEVELYKERIYKWQKNIDRQRQSLSVAHDNAYYLELLDHEQLKIRRANEKIEQAKKEEKAALKYYLILKKEEEIIKKMKHNIKKKHDSATQLAEQKDLDAMSNQRTDNA
jgi:hypothetical protein